MRHGLIKRLMFGLCLWGMVSCGQEPPKLIGNAPASCEAVVLTFDDAYLDNWVKQIHLLDSLGLRATFYLTNYDTLTTKDFELVHALSHHGATIGAHGFKHLNAADFLKTHTLNNYLAQDILPMDSLLAQHDLQVRTFAWPYGAAAPEALPALCNRYDLIRGCLHPALIKKQQVEAALYHFNGSRTVEALGLDAQLWDSTAILKGLELAVKYKAALFLYGHEITNHKQIGKTEFHNLVWLAQKLKQLKIQSLTVDQVLGKQHRP